MKKLILFLTLMVTGIMTNAQCSYTQLPPPISNLTVTVDAQHRDPLLTWTSVNTACWYVAQVRCYTKSVSGYMGVLLYTTNIPTTTNFTVTFTDLKARQYASYHNGSITIQYTILVYNNKGLSTPVYSGFVKIN